MKLGTVYHGKFIKRYKRFFVDVLMLEGPDQQKTITAHSPNTGSMKGCLKENAPVILTKSDNPERKLKYTLEQISPDQYYIGVNTSLTNKIVHEALINKKIESLKEFSNIKAEHKISKETRLDFYLARNNNEREEQCFVEVKNVTLADENKHAFFPDSESTRGLKHLQELIELKKQGHKAVMIYVIQRMDVEYFNFNNPIDPKYTLKLKEAFEAGVEILPYKCILKTDEILIDKLVPIIK